MLTCLTTSTYVCMCLQGHVYAMAKQYADALSEYFQAYRFWPSEPLLLLSIAVTYASWAAAGRPDDRNRVVLLAFAFLQVQFAVVGSCFQAPCSSSCTLLHVLAGSHC